MRTIAALMALLGVVGVVLALVNHPHPLLGVHNGSLLIGVVGVLLLSFGGVLRLATLEV